MSVIKSFSVGEGDMFYISHNSDNFSLIDCCLDEGNREEIVVELKEEAKHKGITRFISTHPDEDHIQSIDYLDRNMPIANFYCVQNEATKNEETASFKRYCALRDGDKAYYVFKGCRRKWMNLSDEDRGVSGISILWPDLNNADFKLELKNAKDGVSFNNMSLIARYDLENGVRVQWHGDLETAFMESIEKSVDLSRTDIVFAPHHGRKSGKIPNSWLDKLRPKIIVLGEAPSRYMHYYSGYNTITQNSAGDITFDCVEGKVHIYVSNPDYSVDFLVDEGHDRFSNYIGTLVL